MNKQVPTIYLAASVGDAAGVQAAPGAVAVRDGRVLAAGAPAAVERAVGRGHIVEDWQNHLLLPALVNAHAHLDLTPLGPRPFDGDFAGWLRMITRERPQDPAAIRAAVREGVRQSREAGVEWLGDVAYSPDAVRARQAAQIPGVSYLEAFGLGERQAKGVSLLKERLDTLEFETPCPGHARGAVVGISPHAPFTAGRDVFDAATELSENHAYRLCTHAAETPDELEFLCEGAGAYADHARHYGCTDADIAATRSGLHPIDHLAPYLKRARWLLVHCNYIDEGHVPLLKRTGTSVAYCPIASEYFGHPREGRHRYRDLLDAGVNVCLGTDSILCQPPDEPQPMGVFAQMRFLWGRDRTDPGLLLRMATTNGMLALEFNEDEATLRKGAPAVFAAVRIEGRGDPLVEALENGAPVERVTDAGLAVS